jgi:threonine dehydrogenase-like Zn-dependent dehydrogenase
MDDRLRLREIDRMNAITFHGVEALSYEAVPDPGLVDDGDVVVRVRAAGICGSDLHPYFGRETGLDVGTVMGHELLGEIVESGPTVQSFAVGERVVAPFTTSCGTCFYCRTGLTARCPSGQLFGWVQGGKGLHGAQAEYVRVPLADGTLVSVPEGLDAAVALLAGDILSTAAFGADLARVEEGDVVAVVGCGPVGLLAIRTALGRGARAVVAVDRVASRLETAGRFGAVPADLEGDPRAVVGELTEGRGADAAIEAVGSAAATRMAADLLRPGGRLAALGVHTEPHLALSPGELYDRNLTYSAGRCPARHYMRASLELAAREAELIGSLVSHRLPLAEGVEAYRRFAAREPGWNKVVLLPIPL